METPSEWAKRFNPKDGAKRRARPTRKPRQSIVLLPLRNSPASRFTCPACGQLLAPSCRVCVACRHPINPAEIARPREVALPAASAPGREPRPEPVRYPWRIFFAVLGISFLLALIFRRHSGVLKQERLSWQWCGVQTFAGVWVFFDALRHRIPRPLRWAVGTMFLLVVIFPWYVARRRMPQSPVPFVEAEVGPVTRFLLFALLLFFLASLIFYIVQGPSTCHRANSPTQRAQERRQFPSQDYQPSPVGRGLAGEGGRVRGHVRWRAHRALRRRPARHPMPGRRKPQP